MQARGRERFVGVEVQNRKNVTRLGESGKGVYSNFKKFRKEKKVFFLGSACESGCRWAGKRVVGDSKKHHLGLSATREK